MTAEQKAWEEFVEYTRKDVSEWKERLRLYPDSVVIPRFIAHGEVILAKDAESKELRAQLCRAKEGK